MLLRPLGSFCCTNSDIGFGAWHWYNTRLLFTLTPETAWPIFFQANLHHWIDIHSLQAPYPSKTKSCRWKFLNIFIRVYLLLTPPAPLRSQEEKHWNFAKLTKHYDNFGHFSYSQPPASRHDTAIFNTPKLWFKIAFYHSVVYALRSLGVRWIRKAFCVQRVWF